MHGPEFGQGRSLAVLRKPQQHDLLVREIVKQFEADGGSISGGRQVIK
jgi:hypothetical protein